MRCNRSVVSTLRFSAASRFATSCVNTMRMIGSNTTLIYADPESVVGRNIHPYTNIDDLEMDDKGEPLRTIYTWPRVIETPDVANSESSESIEPLQMSLLKAARVRH